MLHNVKEFQNSHTIYFQCEFRDVNNATYDVTTPTYSVSNGADVVVESGTLLKRPGTETGIYYIYFTPTAVGNYILTFSGVINGQTSVSRKCFRVVDSSKKITMEN